jgi:hypothetical protein
MRVMGSKAASQLFAVAAALLASGCVSTDIDAVPASLETLQALRRSNVPPLALGSFAAAKGISARSINIRGSTMNAANGSDFPTFLSQVFASELRAAGKFDPASSLLLSGVLTESRASENMAKGTASLSATMTLTRGSVHLFSKSYRVESEWKSDFIGALAIPDAFRNYNALYALLVRQAMTDPEMLAAMR